MPLDLTRKLQGKQGRPHLAGRRFRQAGEFVHRHWNWSKKGGEPLLDRFRASGGLTGNPLSASVRGLWLGAIGLTGRIRWNGNRVPCASKVEFVPQGLIGTSGEAGFEKARIRLFARQILRREGVRHILGLGTEGRAVAQQIIGAFRPRIERRARHGKDFASCLRCESRGDERTGPACRLDDDNRPAKARDNPVAAGEVASPRLPGERHFADRRAVFKDEFKQGFMFGGVDFSQTARQDRDGSGLSRRLMRLRVDSPCEAGDNVRICSEMKSAAFWRLP